MREHNSFMAGINDGFPICLGYLSVAFAFGITAVNSGLDIWQAVLISMLNVTSAGQLAGVPIIVGGGTLLELGATQLIINLRYALMSVSLSQKFGKSMRLVDKLLVSFVNTDEVFAVSSSKGMDVGRNYMYGITLTPFVGWTLGTLLGAVAGNILPAIVISALGIAIYAMFVAIVTPVARKERPVLLCSLFAIALSCIFSYVPFLKENISSGFVIIICTIVASVLFALIFPLPPEQEEEVELDG
ncbi:MAG: AzlC family ABC transporter permease [Clostridia bacterium]|nr:AzlC family ABC transporter permease [Clostridia bacterium]